MIYNENMRAKEVIRILTENGWRLSRISGSHHVMTKEGFRSVPIAIHGNKDMNPDVIKKLEKQTGVKLL